MKGWLFLLVFLYSTIPNSKMQLKDNKLQRSD